MRHGAVVAFKVEEKNGKLQLTPAWMSRDMDQAEPPVIANGVVYAYGSGENTAQAYADRGLAGFEPAAHQGVGLMRCCMRWMPRPARSCIRAATDHLLRALQRAVGGQRARVSRNLRQHAVLFRAREMKKRVLLVALAVCACAAVAWAQARAELE